MSSKSMARGAFASHYLFLMPPPRRRASRSPRRAEMAGGAMMMNDILRDFSARWLAARIL